MPLEKVKVFVKTFLQISAKFSIFAAKTKT